MPKKPLGSSYSDASKAIGLSGPTRQDFEIQLEGIREKMNGASSAALLADLETLEDYFQQKIETMRSEESAEQLSALSKQEVEMIEDEPSDEPKPSKPLVEVLPPKHDHMQTHYRKWLTEISWKLELGWLRSTFHLKIERN